MLVQVVQMDAIHVLLLDAQLAIQLVDFMPLEQPAQLAQQDAHHALQMHHQLVQHAILAIILILEQEHVQQFPRPMLIVKFSPIVQLVVHVMRHMLLLLAHLNVL